ncbi:MAG TPA: serine/threonine-protein kinase, partial [Stenomitos sp.]
MTNSRYRILGEIGQGQFGRVLCASHRNTGQLVALKQLDHRRFPTHRFLRELTILVVLNHPHIVGFHAIEYISAGRYIVMDYCQGGTLRQLIESKTTPSILHKLQIVRDILLGLDYVHRQGIIHCDLKPENILLDVTAQGWSAKIADFGIARFQSMRPAQSDEAGGDTGS